MMFVLPCLGMSPLDAVLSTNHTTRNMVELNNLNPIVFNSEAYDKDIGEKNGLIGPDIIDEEDDADIDDVWRTSINDWMNATDTMEDEV